MIRTASEFQQVYEQSKNEDLDALIDQHYDRLGLEGLDADWIREAYEEAGVIDSEDDYTFLIPRQQPASTVEQISMTQIAELLGDQLGEHQDFDSYSVVGAPLTDKMYGRNAEKRGYAMPVVASDEGLHGTQVADIQDGYSIGAHETNYRGDARELIEEVLGADSQVSDLRELHDSLEAPIVETRGDFTEIQRNMIEKMIAHGQEPEVLGAKDTDGKIVGVKYNAETERYESLDERRDISLSKSEASEHGILPPEVNYETIIFPSAVHNDIGYMLRGLDNGKFRTEHTDTLEQQVQNEGLEHFPFIDVSSDEGYEQLASDEDLDELNSTRFGNSSSLKESGMVLNLYPSQRKREKILSEDLEAKEFQDITEKILNITLK